MSGLDTFPLDTWPLDVSGEAIPVARNRDRAVPVATGRLVFHDGDEDVAEGPWGRDIELPVTVVFAVGSADPDALGTLLNAAYTQTLLALWTDYTLGRRVGNIVEGAFRPTFATDGAPAASGELDLVLSYRSTGAAGQREAICAALATQLAANTAAPVGRRELVLAGLRTHLETALGESLGRNRVRRQRAGQIVLHDGPQVPLTGYTGETIYAAEPRLRIVVTGADHTVLGAALNARVDAVRAALFAGDRRLDGLVEDIRDAENALDTAVVTTTPAAPTMVADLAVTLLYATAEDDPTAVAA